MNAIQKEILEIDAANRRAAPGFLTALDLPKDSRIVSIRNSAGTHNADSDIVRRANRAHQELWAMVEGRDLETDPAAP